MAPHAEQRRVKVLIESLPHDQCDVMLSLAEAVEAAFQDKRHLIVEAGTGVGKSFAYLAPAVLAAMRAVARSSRSSSRRRKVWRCSTARR